MCPLFVTSNRHPFAPPELPDFTATTGASDFRQSLPSSSLPRLVRGCALSSTPTAGSPWLPRNLYVRLDAASDPGGVPRHLPINVSRNVACGVAQLIGLLQHWLFRDSTPSRPASPVTIAPRLLSCLRIKYTVTSAPARLDTRPVASGYLRGVRTH